MITDIIDISNDVKNADSSLSAQDNFMGSIQCAMNAFNLIKNENIKLKEKIKAQDEKIKAQDEKIALLLFILQQKNIDISALLVPKNDEKQTKNNELCFDFVPEKLRSSYAKELWRELYKAGYVDSKCMTTRSRTESAIMAKVMADKLGIKRFWGDYAELWKMSNLKAAFGKSYDQESGWNFEKSLNLIFP